MLPVERLRKLRSFGIIAHVDAGKTSLTERLLHASGQIHSAGTVDGGNTVTDSDPREKARGITIGAAAVSMPHRGHVLSLIDTPGHVDFSIEVERSLRVTDGAIVVLDAVSGVEPQTETVWARADDRGLARIVFINKIDRAGADFDEAVRSIERTFGVRTAQCVVPSPCGSFLLDLVHNEEVAVGDRSMDARRPVRDALNELVHARRACLVEACATVDERLLEAYVGGGEVSPALLLAVLRDATLQSKIVPVLCGSAKLGLGVGTLLDAVVDLLPSPLDCGIDPDPTAPPVAFCFKNVHDGFGKRCFVRVYSGTLRAADTIFAARADKRFRVGRLVRLFADEVVDVDSVGPGEIAAILGAPISTGETLTLPGSTVVLEGLEIPSPVVSVALETRTNEARSQLGNGLRRVLSDDPSLALSVDSETGQSLLWGLGELHLEVTLDKLRADLGIDIRAAAPRVAFRETVSLAATVEVKHAKQSGGPGQFAHVRARLEPGARGSGFVFVDDSSHGEIPKSFVPAIEAGARQRAAEGITDDHPMVDVVFVLLGGTAHWNDSNEMAFALAGRKAFEEAARRAAPVVLEPIMQLSITVPEPALGTVLGDLAGRRGRVEVLGDRGALRTIAARAPLAELMGYVTKLRSLTQGRGAASMLLVGYEPRP